MATFQPATNKVKVFLPTNFEDGWHILKCVGIEDSYSEKYKSNSFKWIWRLAKYPSKEQIVDEKGFPFEFWQFTGSSLGIDRKTGGPTAARKNAEAILGRPLAEGEQLDDSLLLNKYAKALVILNEEQRLQITKLEPIKMEASNGKAAPPAPPVPPEEPPDSALVNDPEPDITPDDSDF